MTETPLPEEILRQAYAGGRLSRQRRIIAETIPSFTGAFTVDQLAQAARVRSPGLAVATVYRAVEAMAESGFLRAVGTSGGAALYARCVGTGDAHHHHAVCEVCGRLVCLDCPLDERVAEAVGASGFTVTRHEYRLYGVCASCATEGRCT